MRCFTPRRFCGRCCVRGEDTAPEPKKAVLADGAKWIRTFSSALGRQQFVVSSEFGRSTGARSSQQLPASANRSSCRAGSGAPSLTARIRRRHTKVALSAVRARRGTEGSNPFPSSGESRKLSPCSAGARPYRGLRLCAERRDGWGQAPARSVRGSGLVVFNTGVWLATC